MSGAISTDSHGASVWADAEGSGPKTLGEPFSMFADRLSVVLQFTWLAGRQCATAHFLGWE